MKKSELKTLIRECLEELNEAKTSKAMDTTKQQAAFCKKVYGDLFKCGDIVEEFYDKRYAKKFAVHLNAIQEYLWELMK